MAMTTTQALDALKTKTAAGTSSTNMPPKTAPKGQPKIMTAPGQGASSNPSVPAATAPTSKPAIMTAPGQGASSNPAVPPSSAPGGHPARDTAPEGGTKGKPDEGTMMKTKNAGFHMGVLKHAQEQAAAAEQAAYENKLVEQGIEPAVVDALDFLAAAGVDVEMPADFKAKVAEAEKCAPGMMAFKKKDKDGDDDKDDKKSSKKDDKKDEKKDAEKKDGDKK